MSARRGITYLDAGEGMQAGYHVGDLFRVYAMNLMLVPVNLSGVLKSVRQAVTNEKSPFKRTPKIAGRTTVPAVYILLIYGMAVYCFVGFVFDAVALRVAHAAFGAINGLAITSAQAGIVAIGLRTGTVTVVSDHRGRGRGLAQPAKLRGNVLPALSKPDELRCPCRWPRPDRCALN